MIQSDQVERTEERGSVETLLGVCMFSALFRLRHTKTKTTKKREKREERMEKRKERSRSAFRTCIYSEHLLDGASQGEREIKKRKGNPTWKKGQEMCKRLEKFVDGVERLENERRE